MSQKVVELIQSAPETHPEIGWPAKYNLFGIQISATTYDEALGVIIQAAKARRSACVSHLAVHGLITATQDPVFRAMLDEFDMVVPDGQPVRIALNLLYNAELPDRVYGPELMIRVCGRAAAENIGVYFYGSYTHVVAAVGENLSRRFPQLRIVGCEPSVFRPLTQAEDDALVRRINESNAGIVLLGLGCPLQERFVHAHKGKIRAVQICVGAAFDFHAGNKKMAPKWMQDYGLEWLFRLLCEPRRLWRRYFWTNSVFLFLLARRILSGH